MAYVNEEIIQALKAARLAKGLSQRDLSARIGVPQSHISKIERGGSDLKLSSLIELARALGLELALVPKKLLPAVEGVVGMPPSSVSTEPRLTPHEIERLEATLARIAPAELQQAMQQSSLAVDPGIAAHIAKTVQAAKTLGHLAGPRSAAKIADLQRAVKALPIDTLQDMSRLAGQLKALRPFIEMSETLQKSQLSKSLIRDQQARNRLMHETPEASRPAYTLDDDDDDA